jgi:LysR substrate binding domain
MIHFQSLGWASNAPEAGMRSRTPHAFEHAAILMKSGAIVGLAAPPPPGIETQIVADEPIAAAVGPGDPFADRDAIRLNSLRDRPLIALPRGSDLRAYVDGAGPVRAARPRRRHRAGLDRKRPSCRAAHSGDHPAAAARPTRARLEITRPRHPGRTRVCHARPSWRSRRPARPTVGVLWNGRARPWSRKGPRSSGTGCVP